MDYELKSLRIFLLPAYLRGLKMFYALDKLIHIKTYYLTISKFLGHKKYLYNYRNFSHEIMTSIKISKLSTNNY